MVHKKTTEEIIMENTIGAKAWIAIVLFASLSFVFLGSLALRGRGWNLPDPNSKADERPKTETLEGEIITRASMEASIPESYDFPSATVYFWNRDQRSFRVYFPEGDEDSRGQAHMLYQILRDLEAKSTKVTLVCELPEGKPPELKVIRLPSGEVIWSQT